jgi:hypothetical protein
MTSQVLDHSLQYAGVVIDGEQNRLRHTLVILREPVLVHTAR